VIGIDGLGKLFMGLGPFLDKTPFYLKKSNKFRQMKMSLF
jgi:hypothetical protein